MITRDLIKEEIDRVQEKHIEVLYRIIKALERPLDSDGLAPSGAARASSWEKFIEATYGCLADDSIERGQQGAYEVRETIA